MRRAKRHPPTKHAQKSVTTFPVFVHPAEEGGYWAECPSIAGCLSQGDTLEETLSNIREAIELCLEELPVSKRQSLPLESSLHLIAV